MTTYSHNRSAVPFAAARRRIDLAIEASWLAALITTVLAFQGRTFFLMFSQPKQNVLHLFALAVVSLWAFDVALGRAASSPAGSARWSWNVWVWAGRNPTRWLLVFVGTLAVAQLLSTLFSPLPLISIVGRDQNDPGYELYSGLSYLTIFAAISFRMRSMAQVRRLLLVIAASGTIAAAYGVSQHFGWDPIGYGAGIGRVRSTLGNPIFLASVLVMSVFATLAVYLLYEKPARSWWAVATALAIGLQISAIWFTGSRGPLAATVAGAVAMALAGLILFDRKQLVRAFAVGTVGLFLGVVIVLLPSPATTGGRSGAEIIGSILNQAAAATGAEVTLSNATLATDNVGNRLDIWIGAVELLQTRQSLENGGTWVKILRHSFGFGPEMYYYSYPLTAPPRADFAIVSHAHDFALQIWLELGLLGIISLVGITVAGMLVLLQVAWKLKRGMIGSSAGWIAVLVVGLVGILSGRVVEQTVGVARVADLTVFWAIVGLVVLAGRFSETAELGRADAADQADAPSRKRQKPDEYYQLWVGGAVGIAVLFSALWLSVDGTALYASRVASNANYLLLKGEDQRGYELVKRASNIDSFSEIYGLVASQLERNSAQAKEDPAEKLEDLLVAYSTLAEFEQTNPWAVNNDVKLAWMVGALAEVGVDEAKGELWDRTLDLDFRMRPFPKVMAFVANSYVALGEFELGIEVADYAIQTAEDVGAEVAQAWWVKGEALGRIDRQEEAVIALQTATEVAPDSQFAMLAHRTLSDYYEETGDVAQAEIHSRLAEEIERALILENSG